MGEPGVVLASTLLFTNRPGFGQGQTTGLARRTLKHSPHGDIGTVMIAGLMGGERSPQRRETMNGGRTSSSIISISISIGRSSWTTHAPSYRAARRRAAPSACGSARTTRR